MARTRVSSVFGCSVWSCSVWSCALAASLLVLAGCTMVGPDFSPPETKTTSAWLGADNASFRAESTELRDWWMVFDDVVLNSLIKEAYEQNLPLRVAGVRVLEARARLAIAVGDFYPQQQQGFGSFGYTRMSEHAPGAFGASSFDYRQSELGLGASWELDFWGKFRRAIEAEDANLLASMAAYDDALVTLLGDVANTYVLIRVLEQQLAVAKANTKIQREGFKLADARFKGGATGERDVQQALTQLRSTEASIPELERSWQLAKNALSVLLGIPPAELGARLGASYGIPKAPMQVAVGIPGDLLRRRPDVRYAELQAVSQSARIGLTKAELYPAFSLSGNFGVLAADADGSDLGDLFSAGSRTAVFGPSFKWNLLNYGQITNAVRVQDALFQETALNYQNTVLLAQREVEDELISFVKAQDSVRLLGEAAAAARKTVELSKVQYDAGATDYTTVINAQAALLSQEDALARAHGALPQALIGVYRALGGGWELRGDSDFVPDALKEEMRNRTDWGGLLDPVSEQSRNGTPDSSVETPSW